MARDIGFCQILVEISAKCQNNEMRRITYLQEEIVFMARGEHFCHNFTDISEIEKMRHFQNITKSVAARHKHIFPR